MADVTGITAVRPGSKDGRIQRIKYGATISVGQPLYLDTADNEWKPADASAEATAKAKCIAVTPGVDGGNGWAAFTGSVILVGATLTDAAMYVVSDTAGNLMPDSDLSTNDYVTNIGRAMSTSELELRFHATDNQAP